MRAVCIAPICGTRHACARRHAQHCSKGGARVHIGRQARQQVAMCWAALTCTLLAFSAVGRAHTAEQPTLPSQGTYPEQCTITTLPPAYRPPRHRLHHRLTVSPPASLRTHLTGTRSPARGRLPWGCLIISTSLSQMRSTEKTVVSNAEALDWLSSGASN